MNEKQISSKYMSEFENYMNMNEDEREIISKYMSDLAKKSYEKSPRSKKFYQKMQAKSVAKRKKNKLTSKE